MSGSKKIVVYHSQNFQIKQVYTEFHGELVRYNIGDNGDLYISDWLTESAQGHAIFARGQWAYVCVSTPYHAPR